MKVRYRRPFEVGSLALALTLASRTTEAQDASDPTTHVMAATIVVQDSHVGLAGFVLDGAGQPVSGAEIRAFPGAAPRSDEKLMRRSHHYTRSGENGSFFIPLVPGNYAVRVNRPGFGVTTVKIVVPSVGGHCVAIRLEAPDAPRRMWDSSCAGL